MAGSRRKGEQGRQQGVGGAMAVRPMSSRDVALLEDLACSQHDLARPATTLVLRALFGGRMPPVSSRGAVTVSSRALSRCC
jgi:hypothetical protein